METFSSFCGSTSTHYYSSAQQFPKTIYIFACVVSVIGSVLSTLGNTMILFALRKCQSLHPPSKALLCSLALTDLFVGLVVLPLFTAYFLMFILETPRYYCVIAVTYGRTSSFIGAVSLETIATIAVDRYLAFRLRLRYREHVTRRRVVFVLVIEWILAAAWSGIWFWNALINMIFGAVGLFSLCVTTPLCYFSIHRGLRRHFVQIRQPRDSSDPTGGFNVVQYKKTVNNMLWIYGLLVVCYLPHLSSQLAILSMGLNNSTRFALHFSVIVLHFNSTINPILYCWKITEIKKKVFANLSTIRSILSGAAG